MPLRAGDEDLTSANKATTKILVAGALFLAIWRFSDLDKVDEFLDGTALQRASAIYFVFITLSLCAFVIFNTMVYAYYLPLGSRTLRIIIWFLCLCGTLTLAFYYGDAIST